METQRSQRPHQGHEAIPRATETVARDVVDCAIKVHRTLGPGLLESVYEVCLGHELELRGHSVRKQAALPVVYESVKLDAGYRIDLIVDEVVIVEVKAADALARSTRRSFSLT